MKKHSASPDHLFVYGSLKPGESADHLLAGLEGYWRDATVPGHHFPGGLPETGGFPALRLDPNGRHVPGMVFSSVSLSHQWPLLDAYEGLAYTRVKTEVHLESGQRLMAWIYIVQSVRP